MKRVSFQGEPGAYSEAAAVSFFDDKTQIDLNTYWISTLIFVAEVFNKEEWKKLSLSNYN